MPKIVNRMEKKLEIANQALLVFNTKGYYNTNLNDVALKCNIGRTTIYKYFKNKDEIYFYILEIGISLYKLNYDLLNNDNSIKYLDKILQQLKFLILNLNGQSVSQAFLDFWLMVRHNHKEIEEKMIDRYDEIIDGISYWLDKAILNGEISNMDTNSMSIIIIGMIEGISLNDISKRSTNSETAYKSVIKLINGLK